MRNLVTLMGEEKRASAGASSALLSAYVCGHMSSTRLLESMACTGTHYERPLIMKPVHARCMATTPLPPRTEASCTSLSHNGSHARRLLLAFWVAVCTCRQLMALVLLSPPPYRVKSSQKTIRKVNGIVSIVSKRTVDWSTVWSTHHLSFKPEAKVRVKPFQ